MQRFIQRAQQLRQRQTGAEALLWQALRNRKLARWKFRRQHPIDRYVVDFVCLDAKLVIEVDGATHSTDREIRQDVERVRVLEACGYLVIRFVNAEIYDNLDGAVETILAELERRVCCERSVQRSAGSPLPQGEVRLRLTPACRAT
ncbi:endonuclease domain-containing protein [Microvirga roseola]|uniref:endonuclease domain-containing protein n=1 Tax=Microvirga roseola TaxID=2883126 RepID=UPI001E4FD0FA|nr:endonuclease domain-containing protein [Microvirga roseola]